MKKDSFDTRPKVGRNRLNVLPQNPEEPHDEEPHDEEPHDEKAVGPGRFPSWLHRKLPAGQTLWHTGKILSEKRLHTVCEEAKCPNLLECWSKKTATFLVLGKECTRNCGFCDIDFSKAPSAPQIDEPQRVAESVELLGLKHVVITMVARDDLADKGAGHVAACVDAIRKQTPGVTIELLTSDFSFQQESLDVILASQPEVFNHNLETVRRLTPRVRHIASYERTLQVLSYIRKNGEKKLLVKSGLMVGLGETEEEVMEAIVDLKNSGCDIITIGQYLQANRNKLRVKAFIRPETFDRYAAYGRSVGVKEMFCGPFVRSSYSAGEFVK
jgi:lipoic acid synthetase